MMNGPAAAKAVDYGSASAEGTPRITGTGPILLFGLPRSGTTWIGKIFDSHPRTLYLHEPDSAIPMKELPLITDQTAARIDPNVLEAVLARTMGVRLARVAGALPRFPKSYRPRVVDWVHRRLAFGAKVYSRFLGEVSLPDLYGQSPRCPVRMVWKSIESVGRIGVIARAIPEARVIHIVRHPCGWMESVSRGQREERFSSERDDWWLFRSLEATPPARRRALTMAKFQSMSELERNSWLWVLWNESGLDGCDGSSKIMSVLYEDVCAAPIEQSRRMFDFAGLEWDAQTERFVRRSVSIERKDYYSVYRDPLAAANKWRQKFSAQELSVVESIMRQSEIGRRFLRAGSPAEQDVPGTRGDSQ